MTIEELIIDGKKYAHSTHVKMILSDLIGVNPLELLNHLNDKLSNDIVNCFYDKLNLLNSNTPLQYVIGNVNFYGLNLKVNNKVLIPRFETEELVEKTLELIKCHFDTENLDIIDLGCGSGAIGLSLKYKLSNSNVTLLDISEDALEIATYNANKLGLDVSFINNNFLENIDNKYNVIISNPPYIKNDEEIEDIVKNNEPHLALYGGVDGLDCYKAILENIKNNLKDDFLIAFEIGYQQKDQIIELINRYLDNVDIICKKDLSDKDRMIFIMNKK